MSKSGKTRLIASTGGFASVVGENGIRYGLNVIGPLEA